MYNLCLKPVFVEKAGFWANCGHCPYCRLVRRQEWQTRLTHEFNTQSCRALFVTLTYKDEFLPENRSLSKRDLQLFFKRLRKALGDRKIKYYAAGEYCPSTLRPHYHAIIFGVDNKDIDTVFKAWGMCDSAHFKAEVPQSKKCFGYTAGYSSKKLGADTLRDAKCIPEFQLQSAGIGKLWCLRHSSLYKKGFYRESGKERVLPRYYRKVLQISSDCYKSFVSAFTKKIDDAVFAHIKAVPHEFFGLTRGDAYYSALTAIRKECNARIVAAQKEWREKLSNLYPHKRKFAYGY